VIDGLGVRPRDDFLATHPTKMLRVLKRLDGYTVFRIVGIFFKKSEHSDLDRGSDLTHVVYAKVVPALMH
jgi:hypothetical protein